MTLFPKMNLILRSVIPMALSANTLVLVKGPMRRANPKIVGSALTHLDQICTSKVLWYRCGLY